MRRGDRRSRRGSMTSWKDPEIAGVRAILATRQPEPGAPPPTFAQRRVEMDSNGELGALPAGCFHEPATVGGVKGERVVPQEAVTGRVLLYLHGGGYTIGSPRSHRPL